MSRWAVVLTFVFGFIFAFGGTAVFSYLGQNPAWVWALFVSVGLWLWQLPALKDLDVRVTLLCAYCFPFLTLWLASGKAITGDIKTFVYQMILGALVLASVVSVGALISFYRKRSTLQSAFGSLALLFFCGWLVAYFSSSTGASSRMLYFAVHYLHMTPDTAWAMIGVLRKSLHFLFYGSIGLFAFRALRSSGASAKAIVLALMFVLMHASFDEIRQSTYTDRTGSVWDVCLDMAGGACFVFAANALVKRKPAARRSESQPSA